jgi:hypothetical protein
MYELRPGPYRYVLRHGDRGTDCAALQINLPGVDVDGIYGRLTKRAVALWQTDHHLLADGIAGGQTFRSLILQHSLLPERERQLPRRFLLSRSQKESGLNLAAFAKHPGDWGYDLGAFQLAFGPDHRDATQGNLYYAYNVASVATDLAREAAVLHDRYLDGAAVQQGSWYGTQLRIDDVYDPSIHAWQLCALAHNWPGAAEHLAAIGRIYVEEGRDDEPEDWIVDATGGRLSTPREWVMDYVPGATALVRWN